MCVWNRRQTGRGSVFPGSQSQPGRRSLPRGPLGSGACAVPALVAALGAGPSIWSQAEVCKFITLTVPDPRVQITGQSHKIVSQSEASYPAPPQTPIPLNQGRGGASALHRAGEHAHFSDFTKLPGSLPAVLLLVFSGGAFVPGDQNLMAHRTAMTRARPPPEAPSGLTLVGGAGGSAQCVSSQFPKSCLCRQTPSPRIPAPQQDSGMFS